jgi:hypothetical protein
MTLHMGKAHEALLFRLAVELGCPFACELPGPVTYQHHGLLLDPAGSVTPSPGLRASVASLALSLPVPCAGVGGDGEGRLDLLLGDHRHAHKTILDEMYRLV